MTQVAVAPPTLQNHSRAVLST